VETSLFPLKTDTIPWRPL